MLRSDGSAASLLGGGAQRSYEACGAEPAKAAAKAGARWTEAARAFLASAWFEPLMIVISVLDAAAVGLEIDQPGLLSHSGWVVLAASFNLFFTGEVALRLASHGLAALRDRAHAALAAVAVLAWIEVLLAAAVGAGLMPKLATTALLVVPSGFVQVLRILRAARLAQQIRDCRVMMRSLLMALPELGWVVALLVLFFLMAACAATLLIGRSTADASGAVAEAMGRFSDLRATLFSLLELALLEGWPDLVRPFLEGRPDLVALLLAFIFFANMGLLNLLTAVVVDRTLYAREEEEKRQKEERQAEQRELIEALHSQLHAFSGGAAVSRERFKEWLEDRESVDTMVQLDFSRSYMLSSFGLCDHEQSGQVELGSLRQVWLDSKVPLTMANCVRFRHHIVSRMEYVEKLNSLVLVAASQLATQAKGLKGAA